MTLRWGIAAAGKISNDFVTAVQTLPETDHTVIAVAARTLKKAAEFAEVHNIPQSYEGYENLAKAVNIDVVYVGTLNPQHLEVSKMMLEHGKHVLCEKPLTLNEKQTRELIECAKKNQVFLMEAIWSRCFPVYRELSRQIEAGAIGEVLYVNATFGFPLNDVARLQSKELGGGAILDLGVYVLQLCQYVFRGLQPSDVVARGHLNKSETDEAVAAILHYPNGKLGIVNVSSTAQLPNNAYIVGTRGTIEIPKFWCPTILITPRGAFRYDLPPSKGKFNFDNSAGLAYEAEEVRQCLREGLIESPRVTHKESIELAGLMDKLRLSVGCSFEQDSQ